MHSLELFLKMSFATFAYSALVSSFVMLLCIAAEFLLRADVPESNRIFNVICSGIYFLFDATFGLALTHTLALAIDRLHGQLHILHNRPGVWFAILLGLLSTAIGDFGYYWLHRWQHSSRWLWAAHKLHHSDEHMNATTTFRVHWSENPFRLIVGALPAFFLPAPTIVLPMTWLIIWVQTFLNHTDVPIFLGSLNRILVNASTHRIHHSTLPQHIDKNFGGVWSVWDGLFGTYVSPVNGETLETGVVGEPPPISALSEVVTPLRTWASFLKRQPA